MCFMFIVDIKEHTWLCYIVGCCYHNLVWLILVVVMICSQPVYVLSRDGAIIVGVNRF